MARRWQAQGRSTRPKPDDAMPAPRTVPPSPRTTGKQRPETDQLLLRSAQDLGVRSDQTLTDAKAQHRPHKPARPKAKGPGSRPSATHPARSRGHNRAQHQGCRSISTPVLRRLPFLQHADGQSEAKQCPERVSRNALLSFPFFFDKARQSQIFIDFFPLSMERSRAQPVLG